VLGVLCLAAVSILGILQKGPLATLLYKSSVTIRGYYWQAGIDMFRSSPLFGVGIDSYGEYFKQYRNPQYSLNYGFDLTSTNAHNVPIQMFATGGIFVGVTYILILISIFIAALKAIMTTSDTRKPFIVIALAAWLSYISQSIVSIDNIGLTIWGWILGGILIGINSRIQNLSEGLENNSPPIRKSVESLDVIKVLVSMSLLIVSIILNSILYKSEKNAFFIRTYFQNNSNSQSQIFYEEANKTFSLQFNDPNYKMQTAAYMVNAGLKDEGLLRLRQINSDNPRNLDVLNMLAEYSEIYGLTYDAIEFRSKISVLDPWNAKNYLRLGNLYKFNGEKIKMLEIKDKILSFASNTSEGKLAAVELAG
jgi:tetratricopeptide (TPR) repeat protein